LIEEKKFPGERKGCPDFQQMESFEIDDDSPLGRELWRLIDSGELSPETSQRALLEDQIRNIVRSTMPVDKQVSQLRDRDPSVRHKALSSLGAMMALGNEDAFRAMHAFLKDLPPPSTVSEVHFKREVLERLRYSERRELLVPDLVAELYRTRSNNTTRQWITDIFHFLSTLPLEKVREPLEKMLKDKRFSYRLKSKIRDILAAGRYR
jgi:hypothetical protein